VRNYRCGVFLLLGLFTPAAHAVGFDYTASVDSPTVFSASGTSTVTFGSTNTFSFECNDNGTVLPIGAINLSVGQDVQVDAPDAFDAPFVVTISITEYGANKTGVFTFQGRLQGNVSQRTSKLAASFAGANTKSIVLNGVPFNVTIGSFCAPGPPVGSQQGMLTAFVTSAPTGTAVDSVALTPSALKVDQFARGTVTLNGPAPRGGALVALSSTNGSALSVPPSVLIPEGATSATFVVTPSAAGSAIAVRAQWNGTTVSSNANVTTAVCWDVNGDGVVDIRDTIRLLRTNAGLDTLPPC
jgi:hypothetical protein